MTSAAAAAGMPESTASFKDEIMAQQQYSDWEDQGYDRQLKLAQALRQKGLDTTGEMRGRVYVPKNPWVNFAEGAVGSMLDQNAQEGQRDLQGRRDAEFKTALARRPDMMEDRTTPGTPAVTQEFPGADAFGGEGSAPVTAEVTPEVLPTTKRVMKPAAQRQEELMGWASDMGNIKHPMAQSLAATGLKGMLDIPENDMAREAKAADARTLLEQKDKDRLAQIQAAIAGRTPPQSHVISNTDDRGNVHVSVRNPDGSFTTQSLGPLGKTKAAIGGGEGGIGKTQFKGMTVDNKPIFFSASKSANFVRDDDGTLTKYEGPVIPVGQAAKGAMEGVNAAKLVEGLTGTIAQIEKNKEAFGAVPGIASMVGPFIGSRIVSSSLTPEQQQTRVNVLRDAAVLINAIYGAALSRGEAGRANTWAVSPEDDYDTVMAKVKGAKEYAENIAKREGKVTPAAAPGAPKRKKYNQATGEFD